MSSVSTSLAGTPRDRPLHVAPITLAPDWAGGLGDELVQLTRRHSATGFDDPTFARADPLTALTNWFGVGDRHIKPALEPSMDNFTDRRVRVFRPSWGSRRLKINLDIAISTGVTVTYTLDGVTPMTCGLDQFNHAWLRQLLPMRDFARRLEQENKPVAPWLHTTGHLVGAESHHERTLMMLADYHPAIDYISAQPFTFVWPTGSDIQSHTPDVILMREGSLPLVVDVRTPAGARDAKWVPKVPLIESAVRALGMGYRIWTGMSRQYRRNLENFTEARVPLDSYERWSGVARELCSSPMPASELANLLDAAGYQRLWALTLIRRMLWRRALYTDMYSRYTSAAIVGACRD